MPNGSSWLLDVPAQQVYVDGTEITPTVRQWEFVGANVAYDSATQRIVFTMGGGGFDWQESVDYATVAALPANTRVANTLTANGVGALAVDGGAPSVGDRILVQDEGGGASHAHNGIYEVDVAGDGATPWQMTRVVTADATGELTNGLTCHIGPSSTTLGRSYHYVYTADPITVNTTAVEFRPMMGLGGPGSSTDNAIVRWDGATGTLIQDSNVTVSDTGSFMWDGEQAGTLNFQISQRTTASAVGRIEAHYGNQGGDASVGAGGIGGAIYWYAGQGGDGTAGLAAGSGGTFYITGGYAGTDNGGGGNNGSGVIIAGGNASGAGNGGTVTLNGGNAGAGTDGNVYVGTSNTTLMYSAVPIGLGTAAVPHGGIGLAQLAIDGTAPHIQITESTGDNYPLVQAFCSAHDEIAIALDAYNDGAWKSSDATSNFAVAKGVGTADLLELLYDGPVAAGNAVTWNSGLSLNTSGLVAIPGTLGIGTTTVPHGGVGAAMLALDGPTTSVAGPHIQCTLSDVDNYPTLQVLNHSHDVIGLLFDSYWDGATTKSSDGGSNFAIYKNADELRFRYDSAIAAGNNVTWNNGMVMDINGLVTITTKLATPMINHTTSDALGGGAAATLGTIGGTGPTAAGQALWIECEVGGVTHWIPAWT
jgi:hypothetical protein